MQLVLGPLQEATEVLRSPKQLAPSGHQQLEELKFQEVPSPQSVTFAEKLNGLQVALYSQMRTAPFPAALHWVAFPLHRHVD